MFVGIRLKHERGRAMKKMMIVMLISVLILNLCACGGSVGKVSSATDPLSYFMSDSSWTLAEIENQFGAFETSNEVKYPAYSFTEYKNSNVSAFGESWDLEIVVSGQSNSGIRSGNFEFDQKNISDKAFIAYRNDIIAYYTELFGDPEQHYSSSDMPAWSWNTSSITIILQDCRVQTGSMNLTFGI